jgi:hypothetical protein
MVDRRDEDAWRAAAREVAKEEARLAKSGARDTKDEEESLSHRGAFAPDDLGLIAPEEDLSLHTSDRLPSEEEEEARALEPRSGDLLDPRPAPEVVSLDELDRDVVERIPERGAPDEPVTLHDLRAEASETLDPAGPVRRDDPETEAIFEPASRAPRLRRVRKARRTQVTPIAIAALLVGAGLVAWAISRRSA